MTIVGGRPAVTYYNGGVGLPMYCQALDTQGVAWGTPYAIHETASNIGYFSICAVNGKAAVCYNDANLNDVMYQKLY
jgi:hypothetical protein